MILFGFVIILVPIVAYIWLAYAIAKDARKRGMSAGLWFFVTIIFPIVSTVIYVIVRDPRLPITDARSPQ